MGSYGKGGEEAGNVGDSVAGLTGELGTVIVGLNRGGEDRVDRLMVCEVYLSYSGSGRVKGNGGKQFRKMYSVLNDVQGKRFRGLTLLVPQGYTPYCKFSPYGVKGFGFWQKQPSKGYKSFADLVFCCYNFRGLAE
uniref:Uncharacterized protein n=1 Tax=Tanacetum cinerariifolium TaxID=118510 RepID=A0A6L2J3G4_TANCI|nr:hypothetical protein [Tanacetum cinerariifolium]